MPIASSRQTTTNDGAKRVCMSRAGRPRNRGPAVGVRSRGSSGSRGGSRRGDLPGDRPGGERPPAGLGRGRVEASARASQRRLAREASPPDLVDVVECRGWFAGEAQQFGAQVGAGGRPAVGVAGEQPVDQVDEAARERRAQAGEIGRVTLQAGEGGVGIGLADERHAAGEALVEHEPERVQVGAAIEASSAHLLGREVLGRAHHHVVARQVVAAVETLGDAEVGEQDATVGRHEDVAGLDVAVDEAGAVGGVEGGGDARADVDRQLRAEPGLHVEQLAQALAVDELHDDGLAAAFGEHVVDGDDVGMGEPGDGDGLAAEALGDDGIGRQARLQPLEGDAAVEREIGGQPHLGHPALGESTLEPVAAGEHDAVGHPGRETRLERGAWSEPAFRHVKLLVRPAQLGEGRITTPRCPRPPPTDRRQGDHSVRLAPSVRWVGRARGQAAVGRTNPLNRVGTTVTAAPAWRLWRSPSASSGPGSPHTRMLVV